MVTLRALAFPFCWKALCERDCSLKSNVFFSASALSKIWTFLSGLMRCDFCYLLPFPILFSLFSRYLPLLTSFLKASKIWVAIVQKNRQLRNLPIMGAMTNFRTICWYRNWWRNFCLPLQILSGDNSARERVVKHYANANIRTFTDLIYTTAPWEAGKSGNTNLGSEESKIGFLWWRGLFLAEGGGWLPNDFSLVLRNSLTIWEFTGLQSQYQVIYEPLISSKVYLLCIMQDQV